MGLASGSTRAAQGRKSFSVEAEGGLEALAHRLSREARLELVRMALAVYDTKTEFAAAAGVSRQTVYKWLSGVAPSDEHTVRLMDLMMARKSTRKALLGLVRREVREYASGLRALFRLLSEA